jgi:hypothetical protein
MQKVSCLPSTYLLWNDIRWAPWLRTRSFGEEYTTSVHPAPQKMILITLIPVRLQYFAGDHWRSQVIPGQLNKERTAAEAVDFAKIRSQDHFRKVTQSVSSTCQYCSASRLQPGASILQQGLFFGFSVEIMSVVNQVGCIPESHGKYPTTFGRSPSLHSCLDI